MCIKYDEVPERLHKYRKYLNLNQQEMGRLFHVSQGQYDRLENGKYIITFESLKSFLDNGGDVYYLFTGQRYQAGILEYYYKSF